MLLERIVLQVQLRLLRGVIVNDLGVKRSIVNAIRQDKNVQVNANVKDVKIDFIIFKYDKYDMIYFVKKI